MLPFERLLQQQYRARDYQVYSDFIHILLQIEKHDELLTKNGSQRSVGSQPLPEIHMNVALDIILMVLPKATHQSSMVSKNASGTRSLETRTVGTTPKSPSLKN
jgi:hypothetical protein